MCTKSPCMHFYYFFIFTGKRVFLKSIHTVFYVNPFLSCVRITNVISCMCLLSIFTVHVSAAWKSFSITIAIWTSAQSFFLFPLHPCTSSLIITYISSMINLDIWEVWKHYFVQAGVVDKYFSRVVDRLVNNA